MADFDSKPTVNVSTTPTSSPGGGLYFIVGGIVVVLVAVGYFMIGMPGLNGNVARAPGGAPANKVDITVQQPAAPAAPAAPAPAAPAAPKQ
jgi:hypothetical protein